MARRAPIRGTIVVPGDKSISHRAVMLAGLADGASRVRGFLHAEDTLRTVAMMRALGARVVEVSPTELRITGAGLHGLREPDDVVDAGNSGTTARIGAGILAGRPFTACVTGDKYLRQRPMDRVVAPLVAMGARITGRAGGSRAPLCFHGGSLRGLRHVLVVASAQVKSALLLAGLRADGPVTVVEPAPSRDHTERMLRALGVPVEAAAGAVTVRPPAGTLPPLDITVPGDFSAAAFFVVLAACVPGSELRVAGVGVNPFRTGLLAVLRRMGAAVDVEALPEMGGEPVADLVVRGGDLAATGVEPAEIPSLVDEVPVLCAAAALAGGRTEVRGASELRVKESDRIGAMVAALTALGVRCGEYPDGLWVEGPAALREGVTCDTRGDHRIAMSLAILSAATGTQIHLTDTACIATSFPGFMGVLDRIA